MARYERAAVRTYSSLGLLNTGQAVIFTIGTVICMLLAARVLTSFNHGAFFGVGSIVAASLVPPQRQAGAVAAMFMGLTIANVVGVPLATWAGEHLGWRASFWGIAGLGVATMAALRLTLPALPAPADSNAMAELKVLTRGKVLGALALTVVGSSAMFTVFTYIVPILRETTHASLAFITTMLVTYGVGLTVGNWLGGRFADRSVDRTLTVTLASLSAILIAFAFSAVCMALTTWMKSWQDFEYVQLAIMPMFLFSATFFPVTAFDGALRWVVEATPLYRGVVLCRELTTGSITWASGVSVVYLLVMSLIGLAVVRRRLDTLLLT